MARLLQLLSRVTARGQGIERIIFIGEALFQFLMLDEYFFTGEHMVMIVLLFSSELDLPF